MKLDEKPCALFPCFLDCLVDFLARISPLLSGTCFPSFQGYQGFGRDRQSLENPNLLK